MSTQTRFGKIKLLGVEVDTPTIAEAVDHIIGLAPTLKGARYVVKPYVEFFDKELGDPAFRRALNQAYLCLPDGVSLKWAAHFQAHTRHRFSDVVRTGVGLIVHPQKSTSVIKDHFGGSNFTWPLLEKAAAAGLSVYLVGSPKGHSITKTAQILRGALPQLKIAGTQTGRDPTTGKYSDRLAQELEKDLKNLKPDIVLFGINFATYIPLMSQLTPRLSHGVLIGEGGTFDYQVFGGSKKKSPQFVQKAGLEWLWRLLLEPQRIRRQLAIPRFIWRVYRSSRTPIN